MSFEISKQLSLQSELKHKYFPIDLKLKVNKCVFWKIAKQPSKVRFLVFSEVTYIFQKMSRLSLGPPEDVPQNTT